MPCLAVFGNQDDSLRFLEIKMIPCGFENKVIPRGFANVSTQINWGKAISDVILLFLFALKINKVFFL
jgi:hypothetical protein